MTQYEVATGLSQCHPGPLEPVEAPPAALTTIPAAPGVSTVAQRDAASLTDTEKADLLDWVSACQSAYHIESTPGHRFGGLPGALEENRAGLVEFVGELVATRRPAPAAGDAQDLTLAQKYEDACIYANANARDAAFWRSLRTAIIRRDGKWLDKMSTALTCMGLDFDTGPALTDAQVDAAADAAIAAQRKGDA